MSSRSRKQTTPARRAGTSIRMILFSLGTIAAILAFLIIALPSSIYGFAFTTGALSVTRILIAVFFMLIPLLWLGRYRDHVGKVIYYLLYFINYSPLVAAIALFEVDSNSAVLSNCVLATAFYLIYRVSIVRLPQIKIISMRKPDFFWAIMIATLLCIVVIFIEFGAPVLRFDYFSLYEARASYMASREDNLVRYLLTYVIFWLSAIFFPLLIVQYRGGFLELFLKLFYVLFCFYVFLFMTTKILLMIPIIFYLSLRYSDILKNYNRLSMSYMFFIGFVVFLVGFAEDFFAVKLFFEAIVRMFFMPGLLGSAYFEYYGAAPWQAGSGFTHPAYEIGSAFFHQDQMLAVSSFWAMAFAFYGYIGVLTVSLVLGLYLGLLNSAAQGPTRTAVVALSPVLAYILSNTSITTSMLTYGLFLLLPLAACAPRFISGGHKHRIASLRNA